MNLPKFQSLSKVVFTLILIGMTSSVQAVKKSASDSTPLVAVEKVAPTPEKALDMTLLFFVNPNGSPCQMQIGIVDAMKDSLKTLANVKFIKTTEPADRDAFSTYGIRGLPSLIILNGKGKEVKRFTPGIQSAETILSALREQNKKK